MDKAKNTKPKKTQKNKTKEDDRQWRRQHSATRDRPSSSQVRHCADIRDPLCLIAIGGAKGIGFGIALRLFQEGASYGSLFDVDEDACKAAVKVCGTDIDRTSI